MRAPVDGDPRPGVLEPGEVVTNALPAMRLVDLQVTRFRPPGKSFIPEALAEEGFDARFHLGVIHDGGSSGPGG